MLNKIKVSVVMCGLLYSFSFGADSWVYGTNQIITSSNSTKLGVGMNSGTPAEKLQISLGNVLLDYQYYIKGRTSSGSSVSMLGMSGTNTTCLGGNNISISCPGAITISATRPTLNGNVQIVGATGIPYRSLDISGDVRIRGTGSFVNTDSACLFFGDEYHAIKARPGLGLQLCSWNCMTGSSSCSKAGLTVHQALISNGPCYVGINCTHPRSELTVAGTITAKAVTVTLTGDWSDFVFKNNYNLKPLSEVENYIKTNNHLEGIPAEKEVKAKGLHVGEMQAKLLQKVEELTLYAIEQNKKIEELAKDNTELKRKLAVVR